MESVATMIVSPTFGNFVFDAVFSTDHSANLTVTQHPVQSGASISDHAYMEPDEVSIEIGMTDVASDVASAGTSRSVNAYTQLRAIMEQREPVTLITRLKTYQNMIITSMSAPDDHTTMHALRASIYFCQINVVSVSTISVQETVSGSKNCASSGGSSGKSGSSSSDAKTATTKQTTKSTTEPKTSVLKKLATSLGI